MVVEPYVGAVALVGDPQERNHFHGKLHHKKTLFLGLRYVAEEHVSKQTGMPYLRMEYANGLFGSLSLLAVEMMCGWMPRSMPQRILYSLMEEVSRGDWLAHVESSVMKRASDDSIFLENRLIALQHGEWLELFSEIYGRPKTAL